MILVAGGTGTLGIQVVRRLITDGAAVRVLTRVAQRASPLAETGAEVMVGDVREAADVRRAVAGATAIVSAIQGVAGVDPVGARAVDLHGNALLAEAARDAGARRFVLVSAVGASPDSPLQLSRVKYAAEQSVAGSSLDWTVIRPTVYLETWIAILQQMAAKGSVTLFGRGRNPINFVSVDDVATLVTRALADDDTIGKTYQIGGPENLTLNELTREVLAATGERRIRHLPLPVLRTIALLARPVRPSVATLAQFALTMDTTEMTLSDDTGRAQFPDLPATTLQHRLHSLQRHH